MKAHKLDALVFPGASGAGIAAKPGYPTVIVPFGLVANAPTPRATSLSSAAYPEGRAGASSLRCELHRAWPAANHASSSWPTRSSRPPRSASRRPRFLSPGPPARRATASGQSFGTPGGHHEASVVVGGRAHRRPWSVSARAEGTGSGSGGQRRRGSTSSRASIYQLQNAMNEGRFNSRDLVQAYIDRINCTRVGSTRPPRSAPAPWPRRRSSTASGPRATCAGRCTASRSASRTSSTPPACRRPAADWPSPGSRRPTTPRSSRTCATPARSSSPRRC